MKKGLLIFAIFVLSFSFVVYLRQPKEPLYCKYADKITKSFRRSVKEKYHLIPTSYGGSFMTNISVISQMYTSYNNDCSLEQARELILSCAEDYLDRINQNEKIRPYLSQYPFSEKQIELSVYFHKDRLEYVDKKYIACVSLRNGKVRYAYYDHESEKFVNVHRETYEEAVRIVKEGK